MNIYLNELDWEVSKAGFEIVRYADDSIVMCKTAEELERAVVLVNGILDQLGLELSEEKTHKVDFHKDNFEYLNYIFYLRAKRTPSIGAFGYHRMDI